MHTLKINHYHDDYHYYDYHEYCEYQMVLIR